MTKKQKEEHKAHVKKMKKVLYVIISMGVISFIVLMQMHVDALTQSVAVHTSAAIAVERILSLFEA